MIPVCLNLRTWAAKTVIVSFNLQKIRRYSITDRSKILLLDYTGNDFIIELQVMILLLNYR